MTNLKQADLEGFAKLAIPLELLELAGVVRVSDREARETYGIKGGGDMAGIAFPYFDPETMSNGRRHAYVRIRRDNPEVEGGRLKKKYVAPYGDRKRLYFPPTPELFADAAVPIVLVEAEKSALALTAWADRTGLKILPIAMGGCWGWIGKIGMKETPTGERVPETGAIRDLNIARDGRKVFVLLDVNCSTNSKVLAARNQLVRQLRKQGADVHILELPVGDWNGPDDYVGVTGDQAMTQLFEGAAEGAKILDDVRSFVRRFVILSKAQCTAISLWVAHTYTFMSATWTPYLNVRSAAPESGKSLLLEVLDLLVCKPWKVDGASPAVLFRKIEHDRPTLLFDELDTTFKGDKETAQAIRQVLNAGAKYNGVIARLVGEKHTPKDFAVFCPKVLAGIGNLPSTVSGRSLPITLKRKLTREEVDYLDHDNPEIKIKAAELRRRMADWTEKHSGTTFKQPPEIPEVFTDRQKDGSRILLAIEDASGDWPSQARTALCDLYGERLADDMSIGVQLLSDVRRLYAEDEQLEKMTTTDLLEKLSKVETSPWAEWNRGKSITAVGLSKLLKPFEIFSRTIRIGTVTAKGYSRDQFEDAWSRYLPRTYPIHPSPFIPAVTPSQSSIDTGAADVSTRNIEPTVTGSRNEESLESMRIVTPVTDQKRDDVRGEAEQRKKECQTSLWTQISL